ncbi:MAG: hypothetical protein VW445_13700, partial [Rhodospirillaceae bacterium]
FIFRDLRRPLAISPSITDSVKAFDPIEVLFSSNPCAGPAINIKKAVIGRYSFFEISHSRVSEF